jgi:hypothetical protein
LQRSHITLGRAVLLLRQAFQRAKQMATEEAAVRRTVVFASAAEVDRVLASRSEYELLQVAKLFRCF